MAKPRGPWQAWVGAALTGVVALVYSLAASPVAGETWTVAGITASLVLASVCAFGAVLSHTKRAALVLLCLALVPLLVSGAASMGMGPAFLIPAAFLIAALVKIASAARRREGCPSLASHG